MPILLHLRPGTKFELAEMPEVTGTLIKATESRAVVRLDRSTEEVEFTEPNGGTRRFTAKRVHVTSWSARTVVRPIGFKPLDPEENDMSQKSAKKKETPTTTKARVAHAKAAATKPAAAQKAGGKMSCIDAAARVLAEVKQPLSTAEMIEKMAAKGYWTSPGGKTPAATLYSAILRELGKGKESRFKKTDKGRFALA